MTYTFLVVDGTGAASRGMDVNNYFELDTEANNLDEAYRNLFLQILGADNRFDSINDWLLDYYGVDSIDELDEDDREEFENFNAKDYIEGLDISGGDPWVEGIMEDGRIIVEPNIEGIEQYGGNIDSDVSMTWFGRDLNEDDSEITEDDCIDFLDGNQEAGEILYQWLSNEDALYDDKDAVLDYDNILDLCDAATDPREKKIVADAIGFDYDEYEDESLDLNNKERIIEFYNPELDLEDLVNDAYYYFTKQLGINPSVNDVYEFIDGNYSDFRDLSDADRSEIEKILVVLSK